MTSEERLRELEDRYENYTVYDNRGDKIGKVDDLFIDEADREEYIGVKMGFLGRKSTLIPMDLVRVNQENRTIEVSETKSHVKGAPSFDDDEDITAEYERRIRDHFGLQSKDASTSRGSYAGSAEATETEQGVDERHAGRSDAHDDPTGEPAGGPAAQEETASHDRHDETASHDEPQEHEEPEGRDERQAPSATGSDEPGHADRPAPTGAASRFERGGSTDHDSETTSEGQPEGSAESSADSTSGEMSGAPTTRQTEETETYEEGGRTRVRRRIVREEIIEDDADSSDSSA